MFTIYTRFGLNIVFSSAVSLWFLRFFKDRHHIFTVRSFPLFKKGFTLYFNNLEIPSHRKTLYQVWNWPSGTREEVKHIDGRIHRRTMGNRRSKKLNHLNLRFIFPKPLIQFQPKFPQLKQYLENKAKMCWKLKSKARATNIFTSCHMVLTSITKV